MSSSSSVLEELLLSLLLDWLCRFACFDLAVSGSGAVYPFEDEPNAAVVAVVALLLWCPAVWAWGHTC